MSDSTGSCASGQNPFVKQATGSGVLTLTVKGEIEHNSNYCGIINFGEKFRGFNPQK